MYSRLFLVCCLVLTLVADTVLAESVSIPDSALEEVLRKAIEKPSGELSAADLATLEKLTIYSTETKDLSGLEHCVNLIDLNCQGNPLLRRIDALAEMPQLKRLVLNLGEAVDISALSSLHALEHLHLNRIKATSLEPLAGLTSLTYLSINSSETLDLGVLSGLVNLEKLQIDRMSVSDLEFVREMKRLRYLNAEHNAIQSLEPLHGLSNLIGIDVESNLLRDVQGLSTLPQLRFLNVNYNNVTSLEGLPPIMPEGLVQFFGNQVSDLAPLAIACAGSREVRVEMGDNPLDVESICGDLPALLSQGHQLLYKYSTRESELEPFPALSTLCGAPGSSASGTISVADVMEEVGTLLPYGSTLFSDDHLEIAVRKNLGKPSGVITPEDLLGIEKLDAGYDRIQKLTGIGQLENLTSLNLSGNAISDLTPIAELAKLESLSLSHNHISSLEPLQGLQGLAYLDIAHSHVSYVWPLVNLPSLRHLDVSGNLIKDPEKLGALRSVSELNVDDASLVDLDFVATLANLRVLSAKHNRLTTLEPFRNLREVIELDLRGNRIEHIEPLNGLSNLSHLDLRGNWMKTLAGFPQLQREATILLHRNSVANIQPLVEGLALAHGGLVELGRNKLEARAFCQDIPELESRGMRVLYQFDFPLENATPFGELSNMCEIVQGPKEEPLLKALNDGVDSQALMARFGDPAQAPEPIVAAAVAAVAPPVVPGDVQGPSADLSVRLADTQLEVSVASSGFELQNLIGVIVLVGAVVLLVIALKLPRASR